MGFQLKIYQDLTIKWPQVKQALNKLLILVSTAKGLIIRILIIHHKLSNSHRNQMLLIRLWVTTAMWGLRKVATCKKPLTSIKLHSQMRHQITSSWTIRGTARTQIRLGIATSKLSRMTTTASKTLDSQSSSKRKIEKEATIRTIIRWHLSGMMKTYNLSKPHKCTPMTS